VNGLEERERFPDAQSGSPQDHHQPARRRPCEFSPAARITAMISSTLGRSAG
jgi:hypothetical protein